LVQKLILRHPCPIKKYYFSNSKPKKLLCSIIQK